MKTLRFAALLALLLAASPVAAQWQTPNHSVPVGRGGGNTGFKSAVPGTAGQAIVSTGAATDPIFGTVGNAGVTPGAADTYKGSLNGTTTADIAAPPCTAANQAWRYTAGVGPVCASVVVQTGYDAPVNMGLSSSVAGNALTINVLTASGGTPSAGSPVLVPFRSITGATGTATWGTISAALSITVPSGATLGTTNAIPFRMWIFLDYNAGVPAIGVATCSNTTTIFPCASWEYTLKTSTAISAAAGTSGVLYATAGVASDAVRIVGFCDFSAGQATAGTWLNACTTLQLFGPGVPKPGQVVQSVPASTTTSGTVTNAAYTALASTPTATITPTAASNLVRVKWAGTLHGINAVATFLRFVRNVPIVTQVGVPVVVSSAAASDSDYGVAQEVIDAPSTAGAVIYSFQGKSASGTVTFPDASSGATIVLDEIMG